jgi:hypothetical protein
MSGGSGASSGGGPSGGQNSNPGSLGDALGGIFGFGDSSQAAGAAATAAQTAIGQCRDATCVADALDNYAAALNSLYPPLPVGLRKLPGIVARAAQRVRHAETRAQATRALKSAIAEVHKTLTLLRADDPIVLKVETREAALVTQTLAVAENKLEKAVGL